MRLQTAIDPDGDLRSCHQGAFYIRVARSAIQLAATRAPGDGLGVVLLAECSSYPPEALSYRVRVSG
jgi:hypothetical protein